MADSFETMMAELGWRKRELSDRLGVHPNTVTQWAEKTPQHVMAYLSMAVELKRTSDRLAVLVKPTPYGSRGKSK